MGNEITSQDIKALINKKVMEDVIEGAIKESAVLKYFNRLEDMPTNQVQMAVLDQLPVSYWQTSNTSFKKLTSMAWRNKFITAEELAVIVPISINLANDASIDVWAAAKPRIAEAFGKKIDETILMGIDKPQSFRMSLVDSAINAGATITGTANLYDDIDKAMSFVEMSDYNPTTVMGSLAMKSSFRKLVDSTGQPIRGTEIDSLNRIFVNNGGWDKTKATMIVGDFSQAVYAIRQDITFDVFTEGSIHDPVTKELLFNLMQQDMIAIRAVMRMGWEIPNPISATNADNSTRFPFAVILPSPEPTTHDITFTVKDNASSPIEKATVICAGQEKKTNASGIATFKVENNATYTYFVGAEKKQPKMGKVEVKGATASVDIELLGE